MIRQEWKKLFQNKILLIVTLAVIIIPTIYTTLFLGSMWDPYGNTDHLPVAVVNKDQPVSYQGKTLNIGKELTEQLAEDGSLDFHFVDSEAARRGLKDGTYYMVITIPENFSANAATLTDAKPEQMELLYDTNPGTNYIASKMSETAVNKIQSSVREEVTRTYAQAVFDQILEVGDGMSQAADGSGKLQDGAAQLENGNSTISENLKLLADSSLAFRSGSTVLTEGLQQYTEGVAAIRDGSLALDDGAAQLENGMEQLADRAPALTEGVQQLSDGADALKAGIGSAESGIDSLSAGAASVDASMEELNQGLSQLNASAADLPSYASALDDAAVQLKQGADTLNTGSSRLLTGAETLQQSTDQLNNGLQSIVGENYAQSEALASGAQQLSDAVASLADALTQMSGNGGSSDPSVIVSDTALADLQARLQSLSDCSSAAVQAAQTAQSAADSLISDSAAADPSEISARIQEAIQQGDTEALASAAQEALSLAETNYQTAMSLQNRLTTASDALSSAGTSLQNAGNTLASAEELSETVAQLQAELSHAGQPSGSGSAAVTSQLPALKEQAAALSQNIRSYTAAVNSAADGSARIAAGIPQLSSGLLSLQNGAGQLSSGLAQLETGTSSLAAQAPALSEGIARAAGGSSQLKEQGTSALLSGTSALQNGFGQLVSGSFALSDGVHQLEGNLPALSDGISRLKEGADTLRNGTGTLKDGASLLVSKNTDLLNGARQLTDGSARISDGARQLYDGSLALGNGIEQIRNGSQTLKENLSDGASTIKNTNASENNTEMFAAPVVTKETQITDVPNNGHAMAPYMMSVGLWVGCIAFSLMYPLTGYSGRLRSGFSWWAGKASVLYLTAVLQAIVMIGALHLFDGFTPVQMGRTLLVACTASLAFMAVMYFFTNTLGKVGSFLMLVFMVIQLAGSVGTYPLELSGSFVPYLHDWVPFTYTVTAFRSTISGGESIAGCLSFLLILFIIFSLLTIAEFQIRALRIRRGQPTLMHWLEAHGLE